MSDDETLCRQPKFPNDNRTNNNISLKDICGVGLGSSSSTHSGFTSRRRRKKSFVLFTLTNYIVIIINSSSPRQECTYIRSDAYRSFFSSSSSLSSLIPYLCWPCMSSPPPPPLPPAQVGRLARDVVALTEFLKAEIPILHSSIHPLAHEQMLHHHRRTSSICYTSSNYRQSAPPQGSVENETPGNVIVVSSLRVLYGWLSTVSQSAPYHQSESQRGSDPNAIMRW